MNRTRGTIPPNRIFCLALTLAIYACSNNSGGRTSGRVDSQSATATKSQPTPECVRGEPEALFATRSEFKKTARDEATESVRTDAPVQLTVRHFGCAHYALDFEFIWPATMPEPKVSIGEAARILESLPARDAFAPVIKNLVAALRKMAEEPYKQPMTMSETETLTASTPSLTTLRIRYDVAL